MNKLGYIKGVGIWYRTELKTIPKKTDNQLQPIFEAFTNSLEAIRIFREKYKVVESGEIDVIFQRKSNLVKDNKITNFHKIEVIDTGIGFEDTEFDRFINLRDDRKNFSNKGTGRVQFLHTFGKTYINSIYKDENSTTKYKQRKVTLSKNDAFLKQNSIIRLDAEQDVTATKNRTVVTFEEVLNKTDRDFYRLIKAEDIKKDLIRHYLAGFCENRDTLPAIKISIIVDDKIVEAEQIVSEHIPIPNKEEPVHVYYSKVIEGKLEKTSKKETFNLKAFILPTDELNRNSLKLISKGEIATEIKLDNILPTDSIAGNRYLFLLSGNYIDERDSDVRGKIKIPNTKEFKKDNEEAQLFDVEEVLIEDIENNTNQKITSLYKEILDKRKEKEDNIEELQNMFLLNPKTLSVLKNKINIDDSDDKILRKVYEAEAKVIAEQDAEIKHQIENLKKINPQEGDYQEKLNQQVNELVKVIPLQNRTTLTQYVARRKLVLLLFDKVLKREIEKLKNGGRIDESLLHNLIFQQHSDEPDKSDLWLINEDFIYFKGISEARLCDVKIDKEKLFKDEFTEEEDKYINSLGEKRLTKRPDVLLFPEEGKCIIIEFKAPDVNVSEYLTQIDFYANLIRNYTIDKIQITTFYGFLIGEDIEDRDVRGRVSRFEHSYQFDYWFRPSENVTGFDRTNGSIYTEVIKYSTLLKRAELRNKIFIAKLDGK